MHPGHLWACALWRLGPLSVGLAANKSQSGKANFETCTRQPALGALKGSLRLRFQAIRSHAGVSKAP